jgi:hypothetical protein
MGLCWLINNTTSPLLVRWVGVSVSVKAPVPLPICPYASCLLA